MRFHPWGVISCWFLRNHVMLIIGHSPWGVISCWFSEASSLGHHFVQLPVLWEWISFFVLLLTLPVLLFGVRVFLSSVHISCCKIFLGLQLTLSTIFCLCKQTINMLSLDKGHKLGQRVWLHVMKIIIIIKNELWIQDFNAS